MFLSLPYTLVLLPSCCFFLGGGGGNLVSVMSFSNLVSILLRVYPMHSLLVYNTGVLLHEDVCFGIYMHSSGKKTT